jgi:hypothetical protein
MKTTNFSDNRAGPMQSAGRRKNIALTPVCEANLRIR